MNNIILATAPSPQCLHYPNRVLRKLDVAIELGVCEKTVTNLMSEGGFPKPRWLNSIPVWMLYDIHNYISTAAAVPATRNEQTEIPEESTSPKKRVSKSKSTVHKAGKYNV